MLKSFHSAKTQGLSDDDIFRSLRVLFYVYSAADLNDMCILLTHTGIHLVPRDSTATDIWIPLKLESLSRNSVVLSDVKELISLYHDSVNSMINFISDTYGVPPKDTLDMMFTLLLT